MSAVEVVDLATDETTLTFTVLVDGERFEAYLRANRPLVTDRVDPVVPVALLAAMRRRQPLHLPGPVSAGLLGHLDRAQDVLQSFSRGLLARTPVVAKPAPPPAPGTGVGCCFSGGVDAFYSALRHEDVTHLVFVVGLDTFDPMSARARAGLESARAAGDALGKELIEVETNFQALTERFATASWCRGPALGAVALALQPHFTRVLFPSIRTYEHLYPWGSHPLLDPLWGTEALEIDHADCETTRSDKVRLVAGCDVALAHLRVCNKQGAVRNCGRCEKCIRTAVELRLAGALDRCRDAAARCRPARSAACASSDRTTRRTGTTSGTWRSGSATGRCSRRRRGPVAPDRCSGCGTGRG